MSTNGHGAVNGHKIARLPQYSASAAPLLMGDRCNCGDGAAARRCDPATGRMPCLRAEYAAGISGNDICCEPVGAAGPCALPVNHHGMHNPRPDRKVL